MFIYTAKFSKKKAVAILLALAFIIAAVILAAPEKNTADETASAAVRVGGEEDICLYIRSLGYSPDAQSVQSRQVTIPQTFDEVYDRYNEMQKECGFDLSRYKGREATLYTYCLTEYPDCQQEVLCDVLVCKGKVIGGNVYTTALDGFMHGLRQMG